MLTTFNPKYGHFIVRRSNVIDFIVRRSNVIEDLILGFCSVTKNMAYGVFKINHSRYSYDDLKNDDPREAYKIDLEPIGMTYFQRRDWYACDVFNEMSMQEGKYQVFDTYFEALNWANDMNNIKDVN